MDESHLDEGYPVNFGILIPLSAVAGLPTPLPVLAADVSSAAWPQASLLFPSARLS
jgi:hypothetical protein